MGRGADRADGDAGRPAGAARGAIDGLIRARRAGTIDRRELIQRAAALGIGGSLLGVALHATSDWAYGAPTRAARAATPATGAGPIPVTGPTRPPGAPTTGGTVTFGMIEEPDTLNPYLSQLQATADVVAGVMDGLLAYDAAQQLRPALATDFSVSGDGLTYTFKLRPGVTFHNGDPFTARDVVATWKMIVSPGFGAVSRLGWDRIADIAAPDAGTVVMTTKEVYAPFLSYVAAGTPIAPARELAQGARAFKERFGRSSLVGTGPFRFAEWTTNERIVLDRFPGYWGDTPKLDRLIGRFVADEATLLDRLRSGEVQLCGGAGALSAPAVDRGLAIDGIAVLTHETKSWQHIDLKQLGFLRETKVRQALDFATPAQRIVDEALRGRATRAVADQAPGTWAFDPSLSPRPYDPAQARRLLDEAGLAVGTDGARARGGTRFALELWYLAGRETDELVARSVADSWNAVGVTTTLHAGDDAMFGPEGFQFTDRLTGGLFAWVNTNDPDDMFYWHSTQIPTSPTGAGGNVPAFFSPYEFQAQIDDLTSRAVATLDRDQRRQLYAQIQRLLHAEVPAIFLYWERAFPAVARNVGGFWPSGATFLLWNAPDWYVT